MTTARIVYLSLTLNDEYERQYEYSKKCIFFFQFMRNNKESLDKKYVMYLDIFFWNRFS